MRRIVAATALVLGAATACGGPAAPPAPRMQLSATAEQWRVHEVSRQLAVALHNGGDVPVEVDRVEPVLPGFDGEAGVDTDAVLPVGGLRVDVPVPFGTGGCGRTSAPSQVVVSARPRGATAWQRVTLDLPHPNALLDKLLAIDCAAQRIAASVRLRFGPWQDLGPRGVRGSLEIERTGAATGPVTVTELDGNVLYRLAFPGTSPLARVTAGAGRASVPFTVTPLRCDPHAFAEVKKPFEFPVQIVLDDAGTEPVAGTVPVDADDRAALDTMLRRICKMPA